MQLLDHKFGDDGVVTMVPCSICDLLMSSDVLDFFQGLAAEVPNL